MLRATFAVLLQVVVLSSAAPAQQARPANPGGAKKEAGRGGAENSAAPEVMLRVRARELVRSVAQESFKWDSPPAAVRMLTRAADLLWEDNQDESRAWLVRAWAIAADVTDQDAGPARHLRSMSPRAGMRAQVLSVAQRRDPKLAANFIEQLTDEKEKTGFESRRGVFDDRTARSEQLLNLARASIERDPDSAARIAEQSLTDGISFQLQTVLLDLRRRDPAAADSLLDAAIARIASAGAQAAEGQIIASYLFTPGRISNAGEGRSMRVVVDTGASVFATTPAGADPSRARRFLSVMQQALLSMPLPSTTPNPALAAHEFATLASSLSTGFRLYAPDLWLPIAQRLSIVTPDLGRPGRADLASPELSEKLEAARAAGVGERELNKLHTEALVEAADKEADPIARKLAYVRGR